MAMRESGRGYPFIEDDVSLQRQLDGGYFGSNALVPDKTSDLHAEAVLPEISFAPITALKLVVTCPDSPPPVIQAPRRPKIKAAA